ncbi:glycosyltransferase family 8 protein [Astrocystis sublimbata]|nr:glycosyltransferase family 8 protein [Astrocystis sublimbata]
MAVSVGREGGGKGEDVYATLLTTDTYLPGALVLAQSLRDAGTTKKLTALVTLDTVSAEAITELKSVYNYVLPVPRIRNAYPANLQLMNRTDLHSAFTKINLWKQTQFRKVVYIDADVVAYRAPDELFDIAHPFSAAPDIGWPDIFNTGVMVLTPNMGDYYAMMAMAERGISFDGADQGLINTHFRNNYNRISFTYNVTPSAHYQYLPAYRHFQSSISMVHFIGSDKPWFSGRNANIGSSPFDEMTGRWWSVYDRHYRSGSTPPASQVSDQVGDFMTAAKPVTELVQYLTKGEYQPKSSHIEPFKYQHDNVHPYHEHRDSSSATPSQVQRYDHDDSRSVIPMHYPPHHEHQHPSPRHHDPHHHDTPIFQTASSQSSSQQPESLDFVSSVGITSASNYEGIQTKAGDEQIHVQDRPASSPKEEVKAPPFQPSMSCWDAQRHPPPVESKPEALNFPATIYEMSKSTAAFIAPKQYPKPPKDMWYEVPKEAPAAPSEPLKPIFPWESRRPKPSRIFNDESLGPLNTEARGPDAPSGKKQLVLQTGQPAESSVTETSSADTKSEPVTPITPTIKISLADPWSSFSRSNAWDEVPAIQGYADSMQKRLSPARKSPGTIDLPSPSEGIGSFMQPRRGSKLTDFPTENERPSLPVTPAPMRRSNFWGGGSPSEVENGGPALPAAEGVPGQSDWDPIAQLQKLAAQHSEELLKKLGGGGGGGGGDGEDGSAGGGSTEIPTRSVPAGSEELVSPTYVARSAAQTLLSPQPVKGSAGSSPVLDLVTGGEEVMPKTDTSTVAVATSFDEEETVFGKLLPSGEGSTSV